MAKSKTRFLCQECGHDELKWLGRCPSCGTWNSFKEFKVDNSKAGTSLSISTEIPSAQILSDVPALERERILTGISELDRVLGQGIMSGSVVLVGGEPGIGKSTLLLQLACQLGKTEKVLYVSGEESAQQIQQRGKRLDLVLENPLILCDDQIDRIVDQCREIKPSLVIVDSIQTLVSPRAGEVPGTTSQLKVCTAELLQWARQSEATLFLVAHVTKEGVIAGPRSIEHMVDTVLYFEHSSEELRCLRAQKNRFGSTHEVGLFLMGPKGLSELIDPSALLLQQRSGDLPPGTLAATLYEGSRVLMVELQALTVPAKGSMSRVYSEGVENNRISRIAAILEKHAGVELSNQDIYIHVAGGLRVTETAADLPIALAIYSARTGIPLREPIIALGELSLAGEIRPVPHQDRRIKAATEQGFQRFVVAKGRKNQSSQAEVAHIKEAIRTAFK